MTANIKQLLDMRQRAVRKISSYGPTLYVVCVVRFRVHPTPVYVCVYVYYYTCTCIYVFHALCANTRGLEQMLMICYE